MSWLSAIGDYISDHKSEIAFGAGIIFTGATTVLAVNATPKAMDSIKEQTIVEGRELTFWEKVKVSWKHYILPAATEAIGLTCLFYGKTVDVKATGAALAIADASQKLLKTYTEKVVEEIGEKKEETVRRAAYEERAKEDFAVYKPRPSEDASLLNGDSWFYYPWVGKKFISSKLKIKAAENVINEKINEDDYVALDDFFYEISDSSPISINKELFSDYGETHGFMSGNGLIEVKIEDNPIKIMIGSNESSALVIKFINKKTWTEVYPELIM